MHFEKSNLTLSSDIMDVGITGGCAHESQKSGSFIRFPNIVLDFSQNVIIYPNMLPFEMVKTT
jgi:hypothetical protein